MDTWHCDFDKIQKARRQRQQHSDATTVKTRKDLFLS